MNIKHQVRILILFLVQIFVLKNIPLSVGSYDFKVFLYPLGIILFPVVPYNFLLIIGAFFLGLTVDIFYNSPGVHAGAAITMAYMRQSFMKRIDARRSITEGFIPSRFMQKMNWFLPYAAYCMLTYCIMYFLLEYFTLYYVLKMSIEIIGSFLLSLLLVLMYELLFETKA